MKKRSLKWIGLTLTGLGVMASNVVMAVDKNTHIESQGGIKVFNEADSAYWFSVGGRLSLDEVLFSGGRLDKRNDFPSGANIRTAFLKLAGGVGDYLTYNLTLDFSANNGAVRSNGTTVDLEDAWVNACAEYGGPIGTANLRLGQFTPPVSIDSWGNYGTLNDTVFLESALATQAFSIPSKAVGLWSDVTALDMFMLSAAVYHPRQNNSTNNTSNAPSANNYQNPARSDRVGASVRLTFVPMHTDDTVLHLGAIGRYQSMNHEYQGVARFQQDLFAAGPEARARNTSAVVTTGSINSTGSGNIRAKSYNVVTGEALGIFGPASVAGEYYQATVKRVPVINDSATASNPRFHGWHMQAGYLLTGETRKYDFATGTLRNPTPASQCGAWEIVARFSYLNLANKNINGGSEHNTTLGVNWFINENVRLAANYIRANIRTNRTVPAQQNVPADSPAKRQLNIFGMRLGVMF